MNQKAQSRSNEHQPDLNTAYAEFYCRNLLDEHRTVSVFEHILRIIGIERKGPLHGRDGDHIASRYPERGWDWTGGANHEYEPAFVARSKNNEILAWMIVGGVVLLTSVLGIQAFKRIDPEYRPPAASMAPVARTVAHSQSFSPSQYGGL